MLQLSVFQCHLDVVQFLLESGAQPDGIGSAQCRAQSPLVAAVYSHSANMVSRLLAFDADPLLKDGYGDSPLDVAHRECPEFRDSVRRPLPTVEQERKGWHLDTIEHAARWNVVNLLEEAKLGARPAKPPPLKDEVTEVARNQETSPGSDVRPTAQTRSAAADKASCRCTQCGMAGARLRCANCHGPVYCDRKCQLQHWRQGHDKQCMPHLAKGALGRRLWSRCCAACRRSHKPGEGRSVWSHQALWRIWPLRHWEMWLPALFLGFSGIRAFWY